MRALVFCLVGCGRLQFTDVPLPERNDADVADAFVLADSPFAPTTDAPPAAVTTRFGECTGADVSGVTTDTHLDDTRPTENAGRRREMRVGNNRVSLLRFDLSSLGSVNVFSATLEISVAADSLEDGYVEIFAVQEAWDEGTGDFSPGIANWTERTASASWTIAGAGAPGSRSTTAIGSFMPNVANVRHEVPLSPAAVQMFLVTNHGMALVGVNDNGQGTWLVTRDNIDAAARPCLVVTYTP